MLRLLFLILCVPAFADFDWQSHRGGRGLYPENTIKAMQNSLKYPITTLELDVVISKDQQVVVGHEPWMNEEMCTSPTGKDVKGKEVNLYKLTFKEIQSYDCGTRVHPRFPRQEHAVEHKPLLSDLLSTMVSSGKFFNIEIKSTPEDEAEGFQPEYKAFTDLAVAVVIKHLKVEQFTLQSFDWRVLRYVHEKYPTIRLSALIEKAYDPKTVFDELKFLPEIFSPDFELLTAAQVVSFHTQNVKVIPWTVNTPDDMRKMIGMHVDGIITDYPDLISLVAKESYQVRKSCGSRANLFEGQCVKIPLHAEASEHNPGWICKSGYVQKRNTCEKVKIPKHGILQEDGKTWVCEEGCEHYRYSCKKK